MPLEALSACSIEKDGSHRYIDDLLHLDAQRPADNVAEVSTFGVRIYILR